MITLSVALYNLMKRSQEFFGAPYGILGGAMTWVSERNLVSGISNYGGFGVLASGAMSPEMLSQEIKGTQEKTSKPFGVNLIVMHPQLSDLINVCLAHNVQHVFLAGGLPSRKTIAHIKQNHAKVICFAPALVFAKRLIKSGADALIIEGTEAGGHVGPVSTSVLAQEILPVIREVPVFVAGGIARGETMVAYLQMGAAGCQLGTRFVVAEECIAHPNFKETFIKAHARDTHLSIQLDPQFPVIPVRGIQNNGTRDFLNLQRETIHKCQTGELTHKEGQLAIEHFWAGALRRAVQDGDVENGSLMAGQSVGMLTQVEPLQDIIQELITQAEAALCTQGTRM